MAGSLPQMKALPRDANGAPIDALGCYGKNSDTGHPTTDCYSIFITNTVDAITAIASATANTATTNVFKLIADEVYQLTAHANVGGSLGLVQIVYGETTVPVAGSFAGVPGSAGIVNATATELWSFNMGPYVFKALPGQLLMSVRVVTVATNQPIFTIRRLR